MADRRGSARLAVTAFAVVTVMATLVSGSAAASEDVGDLDATATALPPATVRAVAASDADIAETARARVAAMTLREKAASVVMGHVPTQSKSQLRDYMAEDGLGGFLLMGSNIPASESALRSLTDALVVDSTFEPLIAIDQEGGDVSRLPWDDFPSSLTLKNEPPENTRDAFAGRAALVARAGIGVNFGVVADETDDPGMFIYRRALGTSPTSAAARVAAAVEGEGAMAASTLKHFPGHGAAPGDSHAGIPSTDLDYDRWRTSDGLPFETGVDAGAPLVMFGHLRYTSVDDEPATLSTEWHRIAREELGFDGVAITDDLGMLEASGIADYDDPVTNAVAALAAGNDMVLTVLYSTPRTAGRIVDGIVDAVERGELTEQRLDEAAQRVATLRLELTAAGRALTP
ncbi:glycoside hydrolase family 3 N-terminal domain-containing protein [Microbacterium sp. C7(2022)]|uniref:glycoside hydrolase family 3 N-terminal domain-containing protein n=1 Tax=Microbacterium sp. C7(2022) TaxID=2992759 RepID=UPI00237A318C|nr:glycoside hydrolase family 3 N-terminal domain-containing protein [Microbacterium sp. C7(2022)]MDE0547001.1 glycoside hydrolase family 3 protein [Microbacterium sp. C7(2022)]